MATGVIPARFASERLPGKPLAEVGGRALVLHVADRARAAATLDRVVVATDDERIRRVVVAAGVETVMTSPDHASGTDRVAEVAESIDDDVFVNIQGDEPEIDPATIDAVVAMLENDQELDLTTAAAAVRTIDEFRSPHLVKVVVDTADRALYFSRAPIPHYRGAKDEEAWDAIGTTPLAHVGLYAYRVEALRRLVRLAPSPLERAESLEQLRALQAGMKIGVARVASAAKGIDTPADLEAFRRRFERRGR